MVFLQIISRNLVLFLNKFSLSHNAIFPSKFFYFYDKILLLCISCFHTLVLRFSACTFPQPNFQERLSKKISIFSVFSRFLVEKNLYNVKLAHVLREGRAKSDLISPSVNKPKWVWLFSQTNFDANHKLYDFIVF